LKIATRIDAWDRPKLAPPPVAKHSEEHLDRMRAKFDALIADLARAADPCPTRPKGRRIG
jgi:hypothetical protein